MILQAVMIFCFILSLIISVMISGAAIAVGSISRDSIEKLMENKVRGASLIYGIIKNKQHFHLMLLTGRITAMLLGTVCLYSLVFYKGMELGFPIP